MPDERADLSYEESVGDLKTTGTQTSSEAYEAGKRAHIQANEAEGSARLALEDEALSHYDASIATSGDSVDAHAGRAAFNAGLIVHNRANPGLLQIMGLAPPGAGVDPRAVKRDLLRSADYFQIARRSDDGLDPAAHLQFASVQVDLVRLDNRTGDYGVQIALEGSELQVRSPALDALLDGAQAAMAARRAQDALPSEHQNRLSPDEFSAIFSSTLEAIAVERRGAILGLNQALLASLEPLQQAGMVPKTIDAAAWSGMVSVWVAERLLE